MQGVDETQLVDVKIPLTMFEHEARDFVHHNLMDFYKTGMFGKEFKLEGKDIISIKKM